jgi:DNA-binding CsgD family transcriptional regulator
MHGRALGGSQPVPNQVPTRPAFRIPSATAPDSCKALNCGNQTLPDHFRRNLGAWRAEGGCLAGGPESGEDGECGCCSRAATAVAPWTSSVRRTKLLKGVGAAPYLARAEADLAAVGMPVAVPCQMPRQVPRQASPLALTGREADVVALVAKTMTSTEVAAEPYVSTHTVEYHLRNVFAKLGIASRRELRKFAR